MLIRLHVIEASGSSKAWLYLLGPSLAAALVRARRVSARRGGRVRTSTCLITLPTEMGLWGIKNNRFQLAHGGPDLLGIFTSKRHIILCRGTPLKV